MVFHSALILTERQLPDRYFRFMHFCRLTGSDETGQDLALWDTRQSQTVGVPLYPNGVILPENWDPGSLKYCGGIYRQY